VVLAREDEYQETRLVAYMVIRPGMEAEIGELRSFLEAKLPDYMVPATFVMLDEMPLSPNGKVDRKALPQPAGERPQLGHAYVAPRDELECYLADVWCEILGLNRVGIHDRFFELGGSSLQAARFINRLQRKLGENIYIVSIFEAPTVAEYAAFLRRDYARSLADELGFAVEGKYEVAPATSVFLSGGKIDVGAAEQMRRYVFSLPASKVDDEGVKNPPALFILSPPRSGTTLLRAMLAGHPGLFAASELQLLAFNTLQERRAAYAGKFSLWLEGTIRAIMELRDCGADEAMCIMEACERQDQSTKQFYRTLQEWIGDRLLVDKSPSYALDLRTLERAERDFEGALYIHLVRHPYAMVRSFERYHMDQVLYLKPHPFSPRQLGELVWLVSHENIVQFLGQVPAHRQHQVHFEQLVRQPRQVMEDLCRKLSLEFHPNLLRPYDNLERSMIDGLHAESKPMGDTRFLEHDGINPAVAEAWRDVLIDDFLGEVTWEMAVSLGYEGPNPPRSGAVAEQREASTRRRRGKLLEQQRRRRERLRKDS